MTELIFKTNYSQDLIYFFNKKLKEKSEELSTYLQKMNNLNMKIKQPDIENQEPR